MEEEISHSDEKLIKKICKENFPADSFENERCQEELAKLETISREAEELCQEHSFPTETDRKRCQKTADICEKAVKICLSRNGLQSSSCQEKKETCQSLVKSNHSLRKMLQKMGKNSQINRINIRAAIKGRNSKNSVQTSVSFGSTVEDQGRIVKYFAGAEVQLPEKSAQYEASYEVKVVYPKINHRWNTKQLLEEELKMELEGKVRYGHKENLREIVFKSVMEKSEEQRQAVRKSPEFQKCSEHEQQNTILSPTCMKVRHQSASIDKVYLTIELPEQVSQQPSLLKLEEYIKSFFVSQLSVRRESSNRSPKEITIVLDISRAGDEAQLKVEHSGYQWAVKNVRLPKCFRGVVPMSLRNRVAYRLLQKITHNQAPASCRIEPTYVGTFDNKTFHYEMNDCKHLLFKDCSGKVPVAVLARSTSESSSAKTVEILSGVVKAVLKPKSSTEASGLTIDLRVQDEKKTIELSAGEVHVEKSPKSGEVLVEIKRYADNVYNLIFHKEMLQVMHKFYNLIIINNFAIFYEKC
jgi:hypothetical protein